MVTEGAILALLDLEARRAVSAIADMIPRGVLSVDPMTCAVWKRLLNIRELLSRFLEEGMRTQIQTERVDLFL